MIRTISLKVRNTYDNIVFWIIDFPYRYGNVFKVYAMIVIEITLLAVAGVITFSQAAQLQKMDKALEFRFDDLQKMAESDKIRNLLMKEIAEKVGVDPSKTRLLLQSDPFSPIKNPDLPTNQILKNQIRGQR
jgi:hypothetical protein